MNRTIIIRRLALALLTAVALPVAFAQGGAKSGEAAKRGSKGVAREAPLPAEVASRERLSVVLGRPTGTAVTLNLLGNRDQEVYVEYGPAGGGLTLKTSTVRLAAGEPRELTLEGLQPNREYAYRLQAKASGETAFTAGPDGRLRTQRAPGETFSFQIIGDSHPERPQQFDPTLYAQTLQAAAAGAPDFFLTIGDDFSVDTLAAVDREAVRSIYRRQRLYLSVVGSVAPIFLVNGNHEQASLANLNGTADNVAVWAQSSRNAFFPQPAPDGFYTGNAEKVEHIGLLRDYYAFTWGDALFVVIDPYWHSPEAVDNVYGGGEKTRDPWQTTLGEAQYAWFKKTLESSRATYTFVFSHHVSGTGRGGVERAAFYEWGGKGSGGKDEFAARRPGWEAPIHALMARHRVTAFVQGHDHLFAKQVLDGVAYITLPEPADPNYALYNRDAFQSGDLLPNSGRVRFTVGPAKVVVEYFREWLPADRPAGVDGSTPAYRFEIPAGGAPGAGVFDERQRAAGEAAAGDAQAKAAKGTPARSAGESGTAAPPSPAGELHAQTLVEYPGATSVGLATAFLRDVDYYYQYGPEAGALDHATPRRSAAAGSVTRDRIAGLEPGRAYSFRLAWAPRGSSSYSYGPVGRFVTRRPPGESFRFAIEADPHFDENSSAAGYLSTLARAAQDSPDFLVDLGDTSMAEKLGKDPAGYLERNRLARSYWDEIGARVPFFMALGNHDGEHGWASAKGQPSSAEAAALRKTWLLDAANAPADAYDRFSDTAYAFQWGDALLVVLDPFAAEAAKPGDDGWDWTLGKKQYDWLAGVLARSTAAFRFVFVHNMLGGTGKDARGGADYAGLYEWGGEGAAGQQEFASRRPGWAMPLHDLFVKHDVDVVFRGHDHFYAREEKDGVVYQLVPQPSLARAQRLQEAELADYGYTEGTFLPSPGYVRVSVSPARALIEYVGDGAVLHSYAITP